MQTEQELLDQLNDNQREAVTYCDGPQLVIAGAGSGKTRVLTYKIAWLLAHYDLKPWNILALTFTNKAANEMKARIGQLVGNERARYLQMGTFHSVFSHILRVEAASVGYNADFTIYDEADSRSLIKNIVKQMGLDDKTYKPAAVHGAISMAKNRLILPDQYADTPDYLERDRHRNMPETYKIYMAYQLRLRQANAMDFDDLLVITYQLFRDHADICRKYVERFQYVLVDEYQDTNYVQQQIVWLLTRDNRRICVVGDDYQSIYAFRGANIENILNFKNIYVDSRLYKLEQNYRSTQSIVAAANSLMKHNERQIPKEVFSRNDEGEKVTILETISDKREAAMVCREIKRIKSQENGRWSDFAILYRTNAQSRIFEEAMRKRSMPYRIYGGLSFYQRKEIKDVIAYFRLIVNPNDEEAFKRIINYPARGIGDTTVGKIIAAATGHNVSLWTVLCEPLAYGLNFNKGTVGKLQAFRELISAFITDAAEKNAYEIGADIIRQSGIINDVCQDNSPENLSRKENIEELVNGMSDFCAQRQEEGNPNVLLGDFLSEVSLLTDQDSDKDGDDEKITLMTVHSAKGLEFKNVFVVGMEENLFPSGMVGDSPRALEEERRLFYVAITRAEEHCFLSYAKTRFRYGKMEFGSPSRFLKDIDIRFLRLPQDAGMFRRVEEEAAAFRRENARGFAPDREDAPYGGKERVSVRPKQQIIAPTVPRNLKRVAPSANTASTSPSAGGSANRVQQGQLIEHERFGLGEVLKVEGEGDNAKATIRFKNAGDKQLLLRFARFKVLS